MVPRFEEVRTGAAGFAQDPEAVGDQCAGESEADARLIAAAPALFEALREVEGRLDRWAHSGIARGPAGKDSDWPGLATQIHDAIAKAEGRRP